MIEHQRITIAGLDLPIYRLNTVVVGSGAAGLNAACRLFREMEETGVADPKHQVALVTRGIGLGTSHNCGSDKQTYYKMGTGGEPDCPADFAETLTGGGCTHGDVALIEGASSLRSFYRLADLGVPFPHNALGEFVGYKTDHDPRQRGTSAGPWTSRFMVRKLLAELRRFDIPVFNRYHLLAIITDGNQKQACGLLCLDLSRQTESNHGLTLFQCRNAVIAGGGPGEMYAISVYPMNQMGPYAAMFEAGCVAHNLSESQFGLASLKPRWNLSGTYQQVIPRYFSTDADGRDEREFLNPFFESMGQLGTNIFLKGYQWPFDHDKVLGHGSSLIDILVHNEMIHKGRRIFMDFRENPRATDGIEPFAIASLSDEARDYLVKSGATQATPIERLARMNPPSIELYAKRGVDLHTVPLEVGVCAQHCNGGFAVDAWWETNVEHLFALGELAGTHGVKRPGGSSLNAGQVGGVRAAQRIDQIKTASQTALNAIDVKRSIQQRMSDRAGMQRSRDRVSDGLHEANHQWAQLRRLGIRIDTIGIDQAVNAWEIALAQRAFLEAIHAMLERRAGSRGSYLVSDPTGELPHPGLGNEWRFIPENKALRDEILTIRYDVRSDTFITGTDRPRPVPTTDDWFEAVWAEFRNAEVYRHRDTDNPVPAETYRHKE